MLTCQCVFTECRWQSVFYVFKTTASRFSRTQMTLLHKQKMCGDHTWRAPWISCLDCRAVVSVRLDPLESSKHRATHAFQKLHAYLRRPTVLFLAASRCIVLIFLFWNLRPFLSRDKKKKHWLMIRKKESKSSLSRHSVFSNTLSCMTR